MSAELLRGVPAAKEILADVARRSTALTAAGVSPQLRLIRVGQRDDDVHYQRSVERRAVDVGVQVSLTELSEDCNNADVATAIEQANQDANIHGIMLFQPLPRGLDAEAANAMIAPAKDIDGMTRAHQAAVYRGEPDAVAPCTPTAVVRLLDHYRVPLEGANVVVVGRSLVVGRPAAMLLLARHATVTVAHSRTRDLPHLVRHADIVVAALGQPEFLTPGYFSPTQTVVDVGIHVDDEGNLVGDVHRDVADVVACLAPAKGGVGAVTTAVLLDHVVTAAERTCHV